MNTTGIHAVSAGHWIALIRKVDTLAAEGRPTPCQRNPEPWHSENRDERSQAAEACTWCPARAACNAFAEANKETAGVWGGRDRTPVPGRPKKTDTKSKEPHDD